MKHRDEVVDAITNIAAKGGHFAAVNQDYYQSFLDLTHPEIEQLSLVVMLDHEREVVRLAGGTNDAAAVERVAHMIRNVVHVISTGLAQIDVFGRLGFVARVGPEPWEVGMLAPLLERHEQLAPVITNLVRRSLPWILARAKDPNELPL